MPEIREQHPYAAWNAALADELFPTGRAGVPVYLAVHDVLLDDCGARNGIGGRAEFVRAVIGLCEPRLLFSGLAWLGEQWDKQGQRVAPPFVAGLGLAVLAAGSMVTDANATQANYYVRLNRLLGVDDRGQPEGFDQTPRMWRTLQAWLRAERRGELVVHGLEGARRFVDPVKSQCFVRSCDIDELTPLLRALPARFGGTADPDDVVPALRAWLAAEGFHSRLSQLLGRHPDDATLFQVSEALCNALEEYGGKRLTLSSSDDVDALPAIEFAVRPNPYPNLMWRRAEWLLRLAQPPDAEETERRLLVGDREVVARLDVREPAAYDAVVSLHEAQQLSLGRMRVTDEEGRTLPTSLAFPAWYQDGAARGRPGSWIRVQTPAAGDVHVAVFLREADRDEILRQSAGEPVVTAGSERDWPGPDMGAVCNVVPVAGSTLPGNVVVPERSLRLRLNGGLSIRRLVYLRGAGPSPMALTNETVQVVDAESRCEPVTVPAQQLGRLDLQEGRYKLACGDAEAEIYVVEPRWSECVVPPEATLDSEVRACFNSGRIRGAVFDDEQQLFATYFRPGTQFRVFAPTFVKGSAPIDKGVYELLTPSEPRNIVRARRQATPPSLAAADCFAETDANDLCGEHDPEARARIERLLEFVSARGDGQLDMLREYCNSLGGDTVSWHAPLSALEDLGHVDISWADRTWTVAPPAIISREGDDGTLVGARARETMKALNTRGVNVSIDARGMDRRRSLMPSCVVVSVADPTKCPALAEVGVSIVRTSNAAALRVRRVTDLAWWVGAEFSPSREVHRTLDRWNPFSLRWDSAGDPRALERSGLFRWKEMGLVVHYVVTGSLRARVRDPAAAKWFFAPEDRCHLVYDPSTRTLMVPLAMGLPRVWRRICTLQSGLTPIRRGRVLVYEHISIELARATALRLNQARGEGLS